MLVCVLMMFSESRSSALFESFGGSVILSGRRYMTSNVPIEPSVMVVLMES